MKLTHQMDYFPLILAAVDGNLRRVQEIAYAPDFYISAADISNVMNQIIVAQVDPQIYETFTYLFDVRLEPPEAPREVYGYEMPRYIQQNATRHVMFAPYNRYDVAALINALRAFAPLTSFEQHSLICCLERGLGGPTPEENYALRMGFFALKQSGLINCDYGEMIYQIEDIDNEDSDQISEIDARIKDFEEACDGNLHPCS